MKHIVRAVVFRRADFTRFLLLHKVDPDRSWWQTVAGGHKKGESWEEGALREMREETGMEPVKVYDLEYEPEFEKEGKRFRDHFFAIEAKGEVKISREHDEHIWAIADEAFALLQFKSDCEAIRKTEKLLKMSKQSHRQSTNL